MKKGFTLIELLAVIAIIGVLALVITPLSLNLINDSKKNTFRVSLKGLVDTAKIYYSEQTRKADFNGKVFDVSEGNSELSTKGHDFTDGTLTIDEDGNISFNVTNGMFCGVKESDSNELIITKGTDCIQ